MAQAVAGFVAVFVDTLNDAATTQRFGERYGSYPVLRVHGHDGRDLAGRIDGNPIRGRIPVADVLALLEKGRAAFRAQQPEKLTPEFESYLAHIAAAEGAARHGDTAAVRRWLDAVPPAERAFEWRWLDAQADQSVHTFALQDGKLLAIAFSPDGKRVALGDGAGRIELRDAHTLAFERAIEGHTSAVYCVSWRHDGARLASSSADRSARIWDAASGAELTAFRNHTYPVTTVRFSPDGARLASTSYQRPKGGEVRVWDAASGAEQHVLQSGYAPITCVHWNDAGNKLVAASWDQQLHVFDLAAPQSPIVARLGPEPEYRAAQCSVLSPDGTLVAVGCKDDEIHLFEAWTGKPVRDLRGHRRWVESVAFAPDGKTLASGSADASVMLWDVASGARLAELRGHRSVVRGLAFSPDGARLLSASHDGTVREWDVAATLRSGARLQFADTAYHGCESPDGTMLAVGFARGDLRLFATGDGRELRQLETRGGWINWLQWSADGERLMCAGHDGVLLFDPRTGAQVRAFSTGGGVDCAALSPDGTGVAAVSRDNKARAWDVASGELRFEIGFSQTQYGIAFSPDSATLAIVGSAGAALHDAASGAVRCKLEGHDGRVRAVKFAPGGETLATAGDDGTARLWNTADGALLDTIAAHDNGVLCVEFAPDGARLATGGGDDRLRLWDVAARAAALTLDAKDMYCLSWSRDGTRLWVLPIAREAYCLDALPLRERRTR